MQDTCSDISGCRRLVSEKDARLSAVKITTKPSLELRRECGGVEIFEQFVVTDHVKCFAEIQLKKDCSVGVGWFSLVEAWLSDPS